MSQRRSFLPRMWRLALTGLLLTFVVGAQGAPVPAASAQTVSEAGADMLARVVFSSVARSDQGDLLGNLQIYVVNEDGSGLRRLTPDDRLTYDWPVWVMGGTRILYTVEAPNGPRDVEGIYIMNADGSDPTRILKTRGRVIQPKMSPDGRSVIFTASWNDFPVVAIYQLDLESMQVKNLTAVTTPDMGFDSDPRWSPDGSGIVFVSGPVESGVVSDPRVTWIDADGSNRRVLTNDQWWYTDPAISPDGRWLATSSYRGDSFPFPPEHHGKYPLPFDWHLVVKDLQGGTERILTQGGPCALRTPRDVPCNPDEGPGWEPVWTPDGARIAYVSVRRFDLIGLYVVDAAGGNARTVVELPNVGIVWHDWTAPPERAPADQLPRGRAVPGAERIVFGGIARPTRVDTAGNVWPRGDDDAVAPPPRIFLASDDRWDTTEVPWPRPDLTPTSVRWAPDRDGIVFTARAPVDPEQQTEREAGTVVPRPRGEVHAQSSSDARSAAGEEQVYFIRTDGSQLRQLTAPGIRDLMDAPEEQDLRDNVEPDLSPEGRFLVFANVSSLYPESWILRLDLESGEVVNLTSVTCGLAVCLDRSPRYSPDGALIAFSSAIGGRMQLSVMNADGTQVRQLTSDDVDAILPFWSPDGSSIGFVRYVCPAASTGSQPCADASGSEWWIVARELGQGSERIVAHGYGVLPSRPTWAPDGNTIAYVAPGGSGQPDIYVASIAGDPPRPLQVTTTSWELFVDWR